MLVDFLWEIILINNGEYRKYQVKTLSSVEKAYIETLKELKQIECNSMG